MTTGGGKAILRLVRIRALMCCRSRSGDGNLLRAELAATVCHALHFICDDETLEGQARHYKQRLLNGRRHIMDSHTLIQALIYLVRRR